jgi:septal ring factor EnvC (AmiA/AmiB activator)
MKNCVVKKSTTFLFISTCLLLPLFSQSPPPEQNATEYEKRLIEISSQIQNLKKKIEQEEKKESSVLSRLNKIGLNKSLITKEISLYNTQLSRADKELSSLQKKIPELKNKLDREKASIEKILVTIYKFGKTNYFDFLLRVEDVGKLISENKHLVLLAHYQDNILSDYSDTLSELETAEKALESKKQEISQLIQKAEKKKQEYSGQEKNYNVLIAQIERNKEIHLKTLAELKDRAEQLQNLMKKLEREKIALPYPLVPLYEKKGELSWPLSGKVVSLFGLHRHPRFKTLTQNNGIEISPQKNTIVKAIHPGRVAYADDFEGYGQVVIIDHGMTYYSLYGHCSDTWVKKGDIINAEQAIANIGDFGSLKGDTLYFEIRYKTKPLNPLQWLKRR